MSGETEPIRVHATVWAIDRPHEKAALRSLISGGWPGAHDFDIRGVSLIEPGLPCPLNLEHPAVLASQVDARWSWMWVLHGLAVPAPRLEVVREHDDGCACLQGGRAAQALQSGAARSTTRP